MTIYEKLTIVLAAAQRDCEHPERAKGDDPFCGKCLSCRAGIVILQLTWIANEQKKTRK